MDKTMTQSVGELQLVRNSIEVARPLPADQAMLGAISIAGVVQESHLSEIADRLQNAFTALRADNSKETGSCIALAAPLLELDEEDKVDDLMLDVAKSQNHGMQTLRIDTSQESGAVDRVWTGLDPHSRKILKLIKRTGLLYMDDNSFMNTTLWALKSHDASSIITA